MRCIAGVALIGKPEPVLDAQAKAFGDALIDYIGKPGTGHGEAFNLKRWPLVSELVLAQQDAFFARRSLQ